MFNFTLLKPLYMAFENLNLPKTKPKKKQNKYTYTGVQSADYFKKDDLISLGKELLQSEEH